MGTFKKILLIGSLLMLGNLLLNYSFANSFSSTLSEYGTLKNGENAEGLQQNVSYNVNRGNIFSGGKVIAFPKGGIIEFYEVENYDSNITELNFLGDIEGDSLKKMGNKFISSSFSVRNGQYKDIYKLDLNGNNLIKVGEILDTNFEPLELKNGILIGSYEGEVGKSEICTTTSGCNDIQTNSPDYYDKLTCTVKFNDNTGQDEKYCYEVYKGDIVYAFSKTNTDTFKVINAKKGNIEGLEYDGKYNWSDYSDSKFHLDYPIDLNGLFLKNVKEKSGYGLYNIVSNVNWKSSTSTGTVDQVVLFSIKVYDNASLGVEELGSGQTLLSGDTAKIGSGNKAYKISFSKNRDVLKYLDGSSQQQGGIITTKSNNSNRFGLITTILSNESKLPIKFELNYGIDSDTKQFNNNMLSLLNLNFSNKNFLFANNDGNISEYKFDKSFKLDYQSTRKLKDDDKSFINSLSDNGNQFGFKCSNISREYKCAGLHRIAGFFNFDPSSLGIGEAFKNNGLVEVENKKSSGTSYGFKGGSYDFNNNKMIGVLNQNEKNMFAYYKVNQSKTISYENMKSFKAGNLNGITFDNGGLVEYPGNDSLKLTYGQQGLGFVELTPDYDNGTLNVKELLIGKPSGYVGMMLDKNVFEITEDGKTKNIIVAVDGGMLKYFDYSDARKLNLEDTYSPQNIYSFENSIEIGNSLSDVSGMKSWSDAPLVYLKDFGMARPEFGSGDRLKRINPIMYISSFITDYFPSPSDRTKLSQEGINHFFVKNNTRETNFGYTVGKKGNKINLSYRSNNGGEICKQDNDGNINCESSTSYSTTTPISNDLYDGGSTVENIDMVNKGFKTFEGNDLVYSNSFGTIEVDVSDGKMTRFEPTQYIKGVEDYMPTSNSKNTNTQKGILSYIIKDASSNNTRFGYNKSSVGNKITLSYRENTGGEICKGGYTGSNCNDVNQYSNSFNASGSNISNILNDIGYGGISDYTNERKLVFGQNGFGLVEFNNDLQDITSTPIVYTGNSKNGYDGGSLLKNNVFSGDTSIIVVDGGKLKYASN